LNPPPCENCRLIQQTSDRQIRKLQKQIRDFQSYYIQTDQILKDRVQCPYWGNCYRLNPRHRASYIHPANHDPRPLAAAAEKQKRSRGQSQYRGQLQSRDQSQSQVQFSIINQKAVCKYGKACYRINPFHLEKYLHPQRVPNIQYPTQ